MTGLRDTLPEEHELWPRCFVLAINFSSHYIPDCIPFPVISITANYFVSSNEVENWSVFYLTWYNICFATHFFRWNLTHMSRRENNSVIRDSVFKFTKKSALIWLCSRWSIGTETISSMRWRKHYRLGTKYFWVSYVLYFYLELFLFDASPEASTVLV